MRKRMSPAFGGGERRDQLACGPTPLAALTVNERRLISALLAAERAAQDKGTGRPGSAAEAPVAGGSAEATR